MLNRLKMARTSQTQDKNQPNRNKENDTKNEQKGTGNAGSLGESRR